MYKKTIIITITFLFFISSWGIARELSLPYDQDMIPEDFNQSPKLDEAVENGVLPPVEERVPDDPYVVEPIESIGEYGGTHHSAALNIMGGGEDTTAMDYMNSFVKPAPDADGLLLNFAKDIEVNENQSTYTIYLREGVKWSDGEPFTTEDIKFWYEDLLLNEEYTTGISIDYKDQNDEVMDLTVIDDYTFEVRFGTSKPYFLESVVHSTGWDWIIPKHFFKNYHPDYVSKEELEEKLEESDYDKWYDLFGYLNSSVNQARLIKDVPTLAPYKLASINSSRRIWERNPYYWKVDTEGNQLPYIEKIDTQLVSDREVLNGKIMSGEIDFAAQNTDIRNYPMFKEYEEEGNYRTLLWTSGMGNEVMYMFNLTHENEDIREIFQNKKFRIAMSLAIDRDEINETIYFGRAKPRQYTVLESSKYYKPEFAKAYIEYNPDKTKDLLDEIGLEDQDDDGWRELPNGKDFNFTIEYVDRVTPKAPNVELVIEYWKDMGIDVNAKQISAELQRQRAPANMMDCTIWNGDKATDILFPRAAQFFVPQPPGWERTIWPKWGRWFETNGSEGEEPPANIKELYGWYEEMLVEPNEQRQLELGEKILSAQAENLWSVGTVAEAPIIAVVNSNMRNIPEDVLWAWDTVRTSSRDPEQFYFEGGNRAE